MDWGGAALLVLGLDTCRRTGAGEKGGNRGSRIPMLPSGRARPDGSQSTLFAVWHTAERADNGERNPRSGDRPPHARGTPPAAPPPWARRSTRPGTASVAASRSPRSQTARMAWAAFGKLFSAISRL
jgi:hypothetical protein